MGGSAQMLQFVAKRLLRSLPTILGIALFNFMLLQLAPGDAADVLAGEAGAATPEYLAQLKAQFGLDQPLWKQFSYYLWNLVQLDLGFSHRHNQPVLTLILERLPATLLLMLSALTLAVAAGILLGVVASRFVNRWPDAIISVLALLAYATPLFWIGMMMIVLFTVQLGWLPSSGIESVGAGYTGMRRMLDIAAHLIMPTVALGLFLTAFYTRLMRASMLEVYNQDYVTTARAKGLSEWRIVRKHVLRNALIPIVTILGLQVGTLLGGSVVVETVFAWPGLGRLGFDAVMQRDLNLLLGILLLCSVIVVITNILVDLAYAWLDPRIALK
jgi:peptide/nickel transport system permease protein